MNTNKSQQAAIKHKKGPMLVLAGPGSGKTYVITNRTKYLIEQYGITPSNILVITFTKAAADEMKERFEKLMNAEGTSVSFGTFHAVYFKILKYAYNYNASNIIREEDRYRYFKDIIRDIELDIEDEKDFIEGISSEISLVKGERMSVKHYYSMNCSEENFQKIYYEYEKKLRNANLIDFDDMLLLCYDLLIKRQDILALWQEKYQYILIDEFQDINQVQYDIIKLLAAPQNNLFIVGDDDQSIYRFRGAKPEIMLNFDKDYPDAKRILLDKNYRSTKKIVKGALSVVNRNTKRFNKAIDAVKDEGTDITYCEFPDISTQNKDVVDKILSYHKNGIPYKNIAVLFRTNTQPRALLEKMMEYNIPFKMKDMIQNLYEHWITKDIIAYIMLSQGSRDRELLLRIINRPKRYISRDCMREQKVDINKIKEFYKDKPYVVERIGKLEYDLKILSNVNPLAAVTYIRRAIGYDDYLIEYAKFRRLNEEELIDTLSELTESARKYNSYKEWFTHMDEYKQEIKHQAELSKQKDVDAVAMSTYHASKGLEYKIVFLTDVNEEITPHRKAVLLEDIEEERRMFYVAMTRAEEELYVYNVKERYSKELKPSRFIGELLMDCSLLKQGERIRHKEYGSGTIADITKDRISICFDKKFITKTFSLEFCIQNQLLMRDNS